MGKSPPRACRLRTSSTEPPPETRRRRGAHLDERISESAPNGMRATAFRGALAHVVVASSPRALRVKVGRDRKKRSGRAFNTPRLRSMTAHNAFATHALRAAGVGVFRPPSTARNRSVRGRKPIGPCPPVDLAPTLPAAVSVSRLGLYRLRVNSLFSSLLYRFVSTTILSILCVYFLIFKPNFELKLRNYSVCASRLNV